MREAEQRDLAYLFRIRLTANVRRAIERAVNGPWSDAGHGWQGQSIQLRLDGWGRQRRVVLRRKLEGVLAISKQDAGSGSLSSRRSMRESRCGNTARWLARRMPKSSLWGQAYRDRADCENDFDEFKNHHRPGSPHRSKSFQLMARSVALVANWWNLFARLADPGPSPRSDHQPAIVADRDRASNHHAGRTTLHVSSSHGRHRWARQAFARIAGFFAELRQTAEQFTPLDRWYRILSRALVKYLHGRQLEPPRQIPPAQATAMGERVRKKTDGCRNPTAKFR